MTAQQINAILCNREYLSLLDKFDKEWSKKSTWGEEANAVAERHYNILDKMLKKYGFDNMGQVREVKSCLC